jgi:hypothetical protein
MASSGNIINNMNNNSIHIVTLLLVFVFLDQAR